MPRGRGQRRQREGWQGAEGHNQHSSSRPRGRSIAQRQAAGARRSHMLVPPGPGAIPGLTKPTTNRFGKKKGRHPDPKPGQASPPSLLQWCWLGLVSVAEHSRSCPTPSVTIQLHSAASPPTQHHSPSPKFPPCPQPHHPGPLLVSQHLCPTARATLSIQHGCCVPPPLLHPVLSPRLSSPSWCPWSQCAARAQHSTLPLRPSTVGESRFAPGGAHPAA